VVAFSLGGDDGRRLPDLDFIAFEQMALAVMAGASFIMGLL
jgi:hypothetical protein